MAKQKARVAIVYDFDGTLSPGNMQEYNFFPEIGMTPKKFWKEAKAQAKKHNADEILAYMTLMLKKANESAVRVDKKSFTQYGAEIELFHGVQK